MNKHTTIKPAQEMETVTWDISPEFARMMLNKSKGNRAINKRQVDDLVAHIKAGRWRVTHQSACMSVNDILLDGHHRLLAIAKSGQTVKMRVTINAPDNEGVYEAIDRGVSRSVADSLRAEKFLVTPLLILGELVGFRKGRADVIKHFLASDFGSAVRMLRDASQATRKRGTSAPIKAAAILQMTRNGNLGIIADQYKALALLHYGDMWESVQSLERQLQIRGSSLHKFDYLVRAYKAFDPESKRNRAIRINDGEKEKILAEIREMIRARVPRDITT